MAAASRESARTSAGKRPLPPNVRTARGRTRAIAWALVAGWVLSLVWAGEHVAHRQTPPAALPPRSRPPISVAPGQLLTAVDPDGRFVHLRERLPRRLRAERMSAPSPEDEPS